MQISVVSERVGAVRFVVMPALCARPLVTDLVAAFRPTWTPPWRPRRQVGRPSEESPANGVRSPRVTWTAGGTHRSPKEVRRHEQTFISQPHVGSAAAPRTRRPGVRSPRLSDRLVAVQPQRPLRGAPPLRARRGPPPADV